jgi:hypothetical protein
MMQLLIFITMMAAPASAVGGGDKTITQVVTLLQEMLDKSKEDGTGDRTVFGKFKCYCDSTTENTKATMETTSEDIERMDALIADKRAQNSAFSQEAAKLEADMASNQKGQGEATSTRGKEQESFEKEEEDLIKGIEQLDKGIDILAAVGADQTVTGDTDSELLMAKDATESAKAMFMAKKSVVKKLDDHMKDALRAASVFLDDKQRGMVSSLLQAPFTGNYNSQSGEIVGVLKNMNDTFTANLANARQVESKGTFDYNSMMTVMEGEYNDMSALFEKRKKEIGETSELVSRTSSEMNTAKERLADDTEFLASLTSRCAKKKAEFEKRNMLRSQEEAAIAEAIAVLNSDEAFSTFGTVDATSTGGTGFIQISESQNEDVRKVELKAAAALALSSKKLHSVRLARIAMELSSKSKSTNPFVKVLENINGTVDLIDAEEADDAQKLATCNKEQEVNEERRDDKKEKMDELEGTISELEISAKSTREQIASTEESLAENRAGQKESTDARNDQNAVFKKELKNLEDAERILAKATKVLTKYYKFLHSHNAEKTYKEVDGKDSGGGNLRQVTPGFGANPELAIEEACSAEPECVAYNSAGWLKSSLAPEDDWYAWDGGKLFIKELNGVPATEAGTQLLQSKSKAKAKAHAKSRQPADVDFGKEDAEFADSQSGNGNKVIDMLKYIAVGTAEEKKTAIETEESAQDTFDDEMTTARDAEKGMVEAIDGFQLDLADTEKSLQEDYAELSTTTDEHTATVNYLADIEPGCSFIQTNYDGRKAAREAEKDALANAVSTLKATPIFQRFLAEAEKEAMGKCAPLCEGEKEPMAECQACLQGVSVFGYCVTNPDTAGCEDAKK